VNSIKSILLFLAAVALVATAGWFSASTPAEDPGRGLCPPNFAYHPGGRFEIVREGERWGPTKRIRYMIDLKPFCLAQYEASRPNATATHDMGGMWPLDVPAAHVRRGVMPWVRLSWLDANVAVTQQGWRLPTYEELQAAASQGDPERLWVFGREWNCRVAERSWFETCDGVRDPHEGIKPTGGPGGRSNYGLPWYDFLGNVGEMTATPWDVNCYGLTRFSLFGHGFLAGHSQPWVTTQQPDRDRPGCFLFSGIAAHIRGEHEHDYRDRTYADDGFRPAADPSPTWADRPAARQVAPVTFPLKAWYFDHETGERIDYEIERPASYSANQPK
jgi:Sulfatase-modifying factor enzyme 1